MVKEKIKSYSKKNIRINFVETILNGFKSIGKGMSNITLFPGHRYSELNMQEFRNGFERDKKSLEEDWKAIMSDWEKVCQFK